MDRITIEAARRNDPSARERLLRELQDPWFRFCISLLGDPELARDAAQETALRFLQRLPTFRGDSSILTWSMGIAVNVAREMRRKRRATVGLAEAAEVAGATRSAPDELNREEMRSLLEQLPDRQREAIVLRFFEDLSVDETAKAMDCAPGTIKATVHQALRKLKLKLTAMR